MDFEVFYKLDFKSDLGVVDCIWISTTIFKRSKFVLWLEQDDERHDVFLVRNGSHSFLGTSNFNGTCSPKLSFPITAHPQKYESTEFLPVPVPYLLKVRLPSKHHPELLADRPSPREVFSLLFHRLYTARTKLCSLLLPIRPK